MVISTLIGPMAGAAVARSKSTSLKSVSWAVALGLFVAACGASVETAADPTVVPPDVDSTGSAESVDPAGGDDLAVDQNDPATTVQLGTPADSLAMVEPAESAGAATPGSAERVALRFESEVSDVPVAQLSETAISILNDPRGWGRAGFSFVADPSSEYRVVLAEGDRVDRLCLPLTTGGTVSCQNGPIVALNADRWRRAVPHWDSTVDEYRGYLVNHEVGHLLGQTHPTPRCPTAGRLAGVMEQQTGSLAGCVGNPWPRDWEIAYASERPVVYAPLPDWAPASPRLNTEKP